jgi:hypothetical protein
MCWVPWSALPLLAFTGLPPREAWPFLAASLCIHVAYDITLAGAYQHGDLSATYPIMRGSAPMLVALGSAMLLGERLSAAAWAGRVRDHRRRAAGGPVAARHRRCTTARAMAYALANACVIAGYTFVDGSGVRAATAAGGDGRGLCGAALRARRPALPDAGGVAPSRPGAARDAGPTHASAGCWPPSAGWPRWARTGSRCGR